MANGRPMAGRVLIWVMSDMNSCLIWDLDGLGAGVKIEGGIYGLQTDWYVSG
jgi:hypothetical protein